MNLWPCIRAELRRGGSALVLLVVIAGLAGGVALAAVAGARRTSSSFDRLEAAEGAPEVFMFGQGELTPVQLKTLHAMPDSDVAVATIIILLPGPSGTDRRYDLGLIAWADDESLAAHTPRHLRGRMPSPEHPEEIVVNEFVAEELDVGPGDHVSLVGPGPAAFECAESVSCPDDLLAAPIEAVVSGVMRTADDLDTDAFNGAAIWAGPGMNELAPEDYIRAVTVVDVQLDAGMTGVDPFLAELQRRFPDQFGVEVEDPDDRNVTGALDVEARSLLVFALVAGVAGLAATSLAFARHLAAGSESRRVLSSLGLTRQQRAWVAAGSGFVVVAASTAVAIASAILGSSLLPVGLAGRAEPDPGVDIDLLVLGPGALVMALLLGVAFVALAERAVARDATGNEAATPSRAGRLPSLPLVAAMGVDLALPRSRRGGAGPLLGAITAVMAAVVVGGGAVVLAASNDDLQDDHVLYGQPWDATVSLAPGNAPTIADELEDRDEVTAVALAASGFIELQGTGEAQELYAVGFGVRSGEMRPVLFDGRTPRTTAEVLLGSDSLDDLGVSIGDTVTAADGADLTVVGRTIVPIVGTDSSDRGAILTYEGFLEHASFDIEGEQQEVIVGFDVRDASRLDALMDGPLGPHVNAFGAPARQPTDVASLAGIGRFPLAIAAFTAALAVAALGHALLVSVRSRRSELATLRALGMQRRDTAGIIAAATATLVGIGLVVGIPVGVAGGRVLWGQIAASVHVVAHAVAPLYALVAVGGVAVAGAVLAMAWPTRRVLRLDVAEAVRTE